MARKPPPEPIDHHYDIRKLTIVFCVVSAFVLPSFGWMVWQDDIARDWKKWQKEFLKNDRERTREAKAAAAAKIDPEAERTYLEKKREGLREVRRQRKAYADADSATVKAEGAWYGADQRFRFDKAEMDSARYFYEQAAREAPEANSTKEKEERYLRLRATYEKSLREVEAAQKAWDQAKARVAALEKTRTDAEEALKKLDEDYDRYQAKLKTLQQDTFYFVRNAPIADMLAPSLKIQQVQLDGLCNDVNFLKSQRVDRCMTCHIAADKRGFEDKERYTSAVLRTHPRLDLFVDSNSPHPYATFGCTSCHAGRDRATDFMRAGHMPNDFDEWQGLKEEIAEGRDAKGLPVDKDGLLEAMEETQTGRWMKEYGWEIDKYNDLPMLPMKAVEAGCFRCHRNEVNHVKAEHLDQGRKLIENLGCWGCHKMRGFEDLPKVGPSLTKLAMKTTPEWTARWLTNPREFRRNTRMPRFFYLENFNTVAEHQLSDTMIAGVVAYLFEKSEKMSANDQAPSSGGGDAAGGKTLFENLGCQGCHISDPKADRHVMDGWRQHGPNLIGLKDKVNATWLASWLKNPKSYNFATRMPNLRLSDDEIQDLVAFLMTKDAGPTFRALNVPKADEKQRDALIKEYLTQSRSVVESEADLAKMTPHEKDVFVGEKIIGHYGCYACHDVPGFEKAKPIGVELSDWGNKPVHLLDFGFVEIPETRANWFHQKVKEPRSFDRKKVKTFQEKLRMPLFTLSEDETRALQSTVLGFMKDDMADSLRVTPLGDKGAIEAGRRLVKEFNCQGCHILEDRGGQIREALKENGIDIAMAPPNIRGEGAKVQSDWLYSFVNAPRSGQIRPWLKVRMPTFDFTQDQLNKLIRYFVSLEKAAFPFENRIQTLDARQRASGSVTFENLKCFQCHPTSQEAFQQALKEGKTPADLAPILSAAHSRLRYDWIADWIKRPDEWMPGTRMPTNFPKMDEKTGKRMSPLLLAIDTPQYEGFKRQLVSIWGSEEEAKAWLADPDRVTKALRDHVWSLGNETLAPSAPARPLTKADRKGGKPRATASGGK